MSSKYFWPATNKKRVLNHLLVFVTHSSLWCNSLRLTSEGLNRLLPCQDGRRGRMQPLVETCHHNCVWESHTGGRAVWQQVQKTACDPVISSICPIDGAFVILCARGRVRTEVENESLVPLQLRRGLIWAKTALTMQLKDIKAEQCREHYFENVIVCYYNLPYWKCNSRGSSCN